jgi:hypothetical protein
MSSVYRPALRMLSARCLRSALGQQICNYTARSALVRIENSSIKARRKPRYSHSFTALGGDLAPISARSRRTFATGATTTTSNSHIEVACLG